LNEKVRRIIYNLWIIPTILICINGIPLIYVGYTAHKRKWIIVGVLCELPFVVTVVTGAFNFRNETLDTFIGLGLLVSIIVSFVYALMIRGEFEDYLLGSDDHVVGEESFRIAKININTASVEEIEQLPGVDRGMAESFCESGMLIHDMTELAQLWQLTPDEAKKLEPYVDFYAEDNRRRLDL